MVNLYSQTEITFMLRQVARACGMSWGHADESGFAARWLASYQFAGPQLLLAYLKSLHGKKHQDFFPVASANSWSSISGELCPIATSSALTDKGPELLDSVSLKLKSVGYPALLMPSLGLWVERNNKSIQLRWGDCSVIISPGGLAISDYKTLECEKAETVYCELTAHCEPTNFQNSDPYPIEEHLWGEAVALAFETFVPVSDSSRAGAGPGILDND